jgi:hypothetical protein
MVVTVVVTAGLGNAPFVVGENRPAARVSVWGGIEQRRKKTEARIRSGDFIWRRNTPRHDFERGEAASDEEKRSMPSCCPPCARRG